jgi:MFS family permease
VAWWKAKQGWKPNSSCASGQVENGGIVGMSVLDGLQGNVNEQLERIIKMFPLVLAGLYVMGFLIVALYLLGYGASSLDLIKIQYLAAGFWFGCAFISFYAVTTPIGSYFTEMVNHFSEAAIWRRRETGALAGAIFAGVVLFAVLWVLPLSRFLGLTGLHRRSFETLYSIRWFVLSMIILNIILHLWLYFREIARSTEDQRFHHILRRYLWRLSTVFLVGAFLFCIATFTVFVYARISFALGGGHTLEVVFWLSPGTAVDSFLEREGTTPYSIPYNLLLENENSLVVISPKDGQRAIEFDRKAIGAMIVLGKRPRSAPVH